MNAKQIKHLRSFKSGSPKAYRTLVLSKDNDVIKFKIVKWHCLLGHVELYETDKTNLDGDTLCVARFQDGNKGLTWTNMNDFVNEAEKGNIRISDCICQMNYHSTIKLDNIDPPEGLKWE